MSRMRYLALIGHVCALLVLGLFLPAPGHAVGGTIAGALDNPVQTDGTPLLFSSSSSTSSGLWSIVSTTVYNTNWGTATQSGPIDGGMYTSITTTVAGPASVSFYQKVSSQLTYDTLTFSLDGSIKSTISGTVNWQQKSFLISAGTHTLVWKYSKNATINGGSDEAWLDKVVVSPNTALKVTSPNGKENLVSGSTVTITWNAPAAAEKYSLYYSINNGSTWIPIPGASAPNYLTSTDFTNITYPWTVPVPNSNMSTCKVKVVAYNAANAVVGTDISDVSFAINNVRLTSPNGGNVLAAGGTFDITWDSTVSAASFTLSYSLNNGTTWLPIAGNVTGVNDYLWTVPVPPAGNMTTCKVKIVASNNSNVVIGTDISDAPFMVQVLRVTSPNGGEALSARNNPNSVSFTIYGPTTATTAVLNYSIDGGLTWPIIATGVTISGPGDYTYSSWNIPALPALKNAKVKVTLKNGTAVLGTDASNANFTITPVYIISGTVMQAGKPLAGATVDLSGAETLSTTTDSLGKYSFAKLLKGGYTVSASKAGSVFSPASLAVAITTANMTTANFTGTANANPTFTISGTVSGTTGTGVVLTLSGTKAGTAMTDGSGKYSFANLPEGNYNVTPGKAGYGFDPISRGVSLDTDTTGVDFTSSAGTVGTYSISGKVTSGGLGLPGVTITASNTANATVVSDALGNYVIKGLKNGSYTITPSAAGYTFTPPNRPKTIAALSLTGVNFSATLSTTARGTAAIGSPIPDTTVSLKDATGAGRTGTTDSNGAYTIDTSGLTPPFLLLVTTGTGTELYSVSAGSDTDNVVNITPLTDLIIRSWYDVQGVTMDSAFTSPGTNPPPTPTAVAVIGTVVKNMVQLWLNQANVTASDFNLISTPFSADGTGVDAVLAQTTVDPTTGAVLVSNGTTTQTSTVSILNSSLTISTTTTNADGTSSSNDTTIVPVPTAQQTALDGITTAFNNFAAVVNAKGVSLVAGDLLPYLDPNGVWGGYTRSQWAERVVYAFAGKTISFSGIAIKSLNATLTTADTVFQLSRSQGGQTSTEPQELFFKKVNNTWLLSGDNRIANVEVRANMVRNQGSGAGVNLTLEVNVDRPRSSPTVTSLNAVTVSGGPWNATPLSYNGQSFDGSVTSDMFGIYAMDPAISGGAPFTFVLTPSSGPTTTYTLAVNAITTETSSITNLTGGNLTTDAHPGSPLTVNWTLPKTFAISQIRLGTVAYTGVPNQPTTIKCDDGGEQVVLGITATTAQVTIPNTCGGQPTAQAEIYLLVYGVNGELTTVYYTYQ